MVMAVPLGQHLNGHTQVPGCLPHVCSSLHQPRRRSVPQGVRDHIVVESSVLDRARERLADALNRLAIPFDRKPLSLPFPAPQVSEQLTGQGKQVAGVS
jgi:hypothetical protein